MTIAFEKSFSNAFKDPRMVPKLLLLTLFIVLSMLLVGAPFMNGYMVRIIRLRLEGKDGLPEWDNMGELFVDGVKLMLIFFTYTLPMLVVAVSSVGVLVLISNDDAMGFIVAMLFIPFQGIIFLYSMCLLLVYPFVYYTVATGAPLGQAFQIKRFFQIVKQDWSNSLLAVVFNWLAGAISSFGFFVFIIGFFPALAYTISVTGDVYGRLLLHWKEQGRLG